MKCLNCGAESSGKYCEYCGSEMPRELTHTINITNNYYNSTGNVKNNKKSGNKTWLWVLGWLFIFPVPLTLVLLRRKNVKPAIKYVAIAIAWILYILIGLSGDDTSSTSKTTTTPTSTDSVQTATTALPSNGNTQEVIVYVEDEVVNRFITDFNENSAFEITGISKGNTRTKYFGYANERYLEMINTNEDTAKEFTVVHGFILT